MSDELEITAEEQELLDTVRARGLPPSEVLGRATRDAERERSEAAGTASGAKGKDTTKPAEAGQNANQGQPVTAGDVKNILSEWDRGKTQQAKLDDTRTGIERTIQGVIADSAFKEAPEPKRRFLEARALELARTDPRLKSPNPGDFTAALKDAAGKAVEEEQASIESHQKGARREALGKSLEDAGKTGETGAAATRSGGQGDTEPAPVMVGAEMEYGAVERRWPTDAEMEVDTHKAADAFLKKARTT